MIHAPTPIAVPLPAAGQLPVPFESVPFDERRWDAWVNKGRLADAAFTEKVQTLAKLGVVVAVAAGGLWAIFG